MKKANLSSSRPAEYPLTWNQVAAFRLSRHHLLKRAPVRALASVAGDIAGVQAQLISAAQTALWSRVRDLQTGHVEDAMKKRSLVKAACMRQTLFLVPAADLAVFVRGTSRRAEKEIRWALGKGVPEHALEAGIDAALNALDEPRTRAEIAERACRILGVQVQAYQGGGWGSNRKLAAVPVGHLTYPVVDLLHLVAARGVVCYGPYRGSEPTFVRADAYIPGWKDVTREQAEDILLHRYLQAFGPATAADFSVWTGMTLREARDIWAREQSSLAPVSVEGWKAEILREDLKDLAQASFEQPVIRLLPYFDTFLLGHKERDHLVTMEQRPSVYRAQGWIAPVVLVNGRVIGVWETTMEKDHLRVQVTKFGSIPSIIAAGIREETRDLGRFLGASITDTRIE